MYVAGTSGGRGYGRNKRLPSPTRMQEGPLATMDMLRSFLPRQSNPVENTQLEAKLKLLLGPLVGNSSIGGPTSSMGKPGGLAGLLGGPLGNPQKIVPGTVFKKEGGPELSPVQVALAQLDNLINQSTDFPAGPSQQDLQQALNESAAGLRKQYGAQIGAIQNQNAGARSDVRTGSKQVRKMYAALSRSNNRMGQRQFKQGKKLAHQLQGMGKREGDIVTSQANDINQAALQGAAGLGLANLGSDLVQGTNQRAQELSSNAVAEGGRAARTERRIAGNDRTYMQNIGQADRLEGTNRSADMYADLQDYLQQNRSQIAALAGQRAAAIAQAKAGIQESFANAQQDYAGAQADARQDLINNKMELLKLALSIQADQREGRQGSSAEDRLEEFYDMLPDQISGPSRILSQTNDPIVTKLYEQLSGTVPMRYGYTGQKQDDTDVPLVDNMANVEAFVRSRIGDAAWSSMSQAQRTAITSALLLQLQGLG